MNWSSLRVMVTGGSGFLGSQLCAELHDRGCRQVFVPRSRQYDLRTADGVRQALAAARPDLVIHLAAAVGGIGANRRSPASFFFDNAMMGLQLIDGCYRAGVRKTVVSAS